MVLVGTLGLYRDDLNDDESDVWAGVPPPLRIAFDCRFCSCCLLFASDRRV